jgi:hypothetical protein
VLLFYRILLLNFKRTASEDISGTNIDYKNLVLFSLLSLYCESYVTSFMTRARLKFDVEVGKKFFKSNIRQKKVERSPLWWLVSGTYSTHTVHYSVWTMIFIIPRLNIIIIWVVSLIKLWSQERQRRIWWTIWWTTWWTVSYLQHDWKWVNTLFNKDIIF